MTDEPRVGNAAISIPKGFFTDAEARTMADAIVAWIMPNSGPQRWPAQIEAPDTHHTAYLKAKIAAAKTRLL